MLERFKTVVSIIFKKSEKKDAAKATPFRKPKKRRELFVSETLMPYNKRGTNPKCSYSVVC